MEFIDNYLTKWDEFAQGDNSVAPYLKEQKDNFESELSTRLVAGDKRAPSRMVFYAVVQVGGFIPCESSLGKACSKLVGKDVPFGPEKGGKTYFAGDLYFWWLENQTSFQSFHLLDKWCSRDFAKQTVIPMYEATCKKKKKPGSS